MKRLASIVSIVAILVMVLSLFGAAPAQADGKLRVFVQFVPGQKAAVEKALSAAGAEFHYSFDELDAFAVSVPEAALQGLSRNPNVVLIEEDSLRAPIGIMPSVAAMSLPTQVVPYGIDMVQARDVWDANRDGVVDSSSTPTGSGRKICIIDSGRYSAHEDFQSYQGTVSGYSTNWTSDGLGHGTHVAGTISAVNNTKGVVGVTPGTVDLYIVRVFGDDGSWTYASTLIDAAYKCRDAGANIISMSLGGSRSNRTEMNGFNTLYNTNGILSIAAAGNEGTSAYSYPASYDSVVSVAAIDSSKAVADFSQFNTQVELAAPGVGVLSTVPYLDDTSLTVGGVTYAAGHIEFSARGSASGALVNGGLCDSVGSWSGEVVLCERGVISFYDKVHNVQLGGGAAAAIYNNVPGGFLGTLGEGYSSTIIGISLSQENGQYLVANKLGQSATVTSTYTEQVSGYEYYDGTSMATPHVSAVAALVWSYNPSLTNAQIRSALTSTAMDLGTAGRDVYYGYGLVRAAAALTSLGWTGGGGTNTAPSVTISTPVNNATFPSGTSISFTGSATDIEDGNLTNNLVWKSDGVQIGTGGSFSAVLSDGTHTITASVTDSGGLITTQSISITVQPASGKTITVGSLTGKSAKSGNGWKATVTISVVDELAAPVAGVLVTGKFNTTAISCTTGTTGTCSVTSAKLSSSVPSVTYTVTNLTLSGYTYVPGITTVTVTKP